MLAGDALLQAEIIHLVNQLVAKDKEKLLERARKWLTHITSPSAKFAMRGRNAIYFLH